jgi:serine/threonine protein kinase
MSLSDGYVLQGKIGSGTYSVVWKAIRKSDGREVAVKEIPLRSLALSRRLRGEVKSAADFEEVEILRRISHPNVVQLLDFFEVSFVQKSRFSSP